MIIVYCCYGGAHSSPIAAAIHLGKLNEDEIPSDTEIWNIHYYDKVDSRDRGRTLPVGHDKYGNEIYVCGRGSEKRGIEQAIRSGIHLAGGHIDDIVFVDTLPAVNHLMRIGGFLSRQLKWISWGRPLVIKGTQKAYPNLVTIVRELKAQLDEGVASTDIITAKKKKEN